MDMIIFVQSVAIQFGRLFEIFCITKCDKGISIQSATGFDYKSREVLQSLTNCYYKVRQE